MLRGAKRERAERERHRRTCEPGPCHQLEIQEPGEDQGGRNPREAPSDQECGEPSGRCGEPDVEAERQSSLDGDGGPAHREQPCQYEEQGGRVVAVEVAKGDLAPEQKVRVRERQPLVVEAHGFPQPLHESVQREREEGDPGGRKRPAPHVSGNTTRGRTQHGAPGPRTVRSTARGPALDAPLSARLRLPSDT